MLYIVATPIGNLEDITLRALRILKEADFILAEDTRNTQKLLNFYEIKTKIFSFHEHSEENKFEKILEELSNGKKAALVTDAGTPGISDPGAKLINFIRDKNSEIEIITIPGASSLSAALSISGLKGHEFLFLGFAPHKKGRETFFKNIKDSKIPIVFFESTHRIEKALDNLIKHAPNKTIKIFKELTKIHEKVLIGTPELVKKQIEENSDLKKGEFVIMVE
jgi:16S rRNA (cytidine1402-2'-O)-methyltransferase